MADDLVERAKRLSADLDAKDYVLIGVIDEMTGRIEALEKQVREVRASLTKPGALDYRIADALSAIPTPPAGDE